MRSTSVAALLGLAAPALASPLAPRGAPDAEKAQAVEEAYRFSWKGYYDYAFPNDTLAPLNKSYVNDR